MIDILWIISQKQAINILFYLILIKKLLDFHVISNIFSKMDFLSFFLIRIVFRISNHISNLTNLIIFNLIYFFQIFHYLLY